MFYPTVIMIAPDSGDCQVSKNSSPSWLEGRAVSEIKTGWHKPRGQAVMAGISYKKELEDNARAMARDARVAFGAFLSRPQWEWYATHTFKGDFMSPKLGDKHYYAWFRSLQMAANAKGMPRPFYFRVTEFQQREVIHYHSLIGGVGDIRRLLFKDFWELHGFARVEAYDPDRGAASYVGKYLTKDDGDIRFSHNLTRHLTKGVKSS